MTIDSNLAKLINITIRFNFTFDFDIYLNCTERVIYIFKVVHRNEIFY